MTEYTRDYYGGALMVLIGLSAVCLGSRYGIGSMTHMRAGYFPVSLGAILALLGVAIAGSAAMKPRREHAQEETLPPEWYDRDVATVEELVGKLIERRSGVRDLITEFRESSREPFPNWNRKSVAFGPRRFVAPDGDDSVPERVM